MLEKLRALPVVPPLVTLSRLARNAIEVRLEDGMTEMKEEASQRPDMLVSNDAARMFQIFHACRISA